MTLNPLLDVKDLEKQKFLEDDSGNVAVRVDATFDVEYASTLSSSNVTLTNANTEYNHSLPSNVKQFMLRPRTASDVRYAWVTGKVATPIEPYSTLPAGMELSVDAVKFASQTVYFATAISGTVVEVEMIS